jgi:hypothetical protein
MAKDWIRAVFDAVIAQEESVLNMVSPEKKRDASGRSCTLLIDWEKENGWKIVPYDFWFTADHGVQWKPEGVPVRNEIYMSMKTFYALMRGWIDPETARMHGLIRISGERGFYDALEFNKIWDAISEKLLKPIIERSLVPTMEGSKQ